MSKDESTSEIISERGSIVRAPLFANFPFLIVLLHNYMSSQSSCCRRDFPPCSGMFVRSRTNGRRVRIKSERNTLFATTSHINDGVRMKMMAYKQSLAPDTSDVEGEEEEEVLNDENVDPADLKNINERVPVPNVLPIPAFFVTALTYSSDAATLCLAAISAIKERAPRQERIRCDLRTQVERRMWRRGCGTWHVGTGPTG